MGVHRSVLPTSSLLVWTADFKSELVHKQKKVGKILVGKKQHKMKKLQEVFAFVHQSFQWIASQSAKNKVRT